MYLAVVKYVGGFWNGHTEKFPFEDKEAASDFLYCIWNDESKSGRSVSEKANETFFIKEENMGQVKRPNETVVFSLEEENDGDSKEGFVNINGKASFVIDLLEGFL